MKFILISKQFITAHNQLRWKVSCLCLFDKGENNKQKIGGLRERDEQCRKDNRWFKSVILKIAKKNKSF